jgi:dTDP-4-dehydrorhamnose 3,5-epimerase
MTQPLDITRPRTPGVQLLRPFHAVDHRGDFCKFFDIDVQRTFGLANRIEECFVTTSHDRVLRGMHLQLPPHDHAKFVTCTQGRVLDVVLDLRVDSPRFGMAEGFELDGASPRTVAMPSGLAHGFCVLSGPARHAAPRAIPRHGHPLGFLRIRVARVRPVGLRPRRRPTPIG